MRKKVGISIFKVCLSFVLAVSLCPALSFAEDLPDSVEPDPEDTSNSTVIAELGNALDAPSAEDPSGEASDPGDVDVPFPGGAEAGAADGSGEGAEAAGPFGQPDTDVDPGAPEPPREAPLADGSYVVLPACSSSRVLDVAGGSSADGADVRLWASNMTGAQRVVAKVDLETGLYELTFVGTGKALDVSGAGTAAGTNVQQWTANGTKAQRWAISENADGTYSVESALAEGLSLDVAGAGDFDGAGIDVWPANGTAAQRFSFVPAPAQVEPAGRTVDDGVYELVGAGSGKALDVSGASRADGARAQIWARNSTMAQMFRVALGPDGFYSVRAVHSGKALDADLGNVVPGARVNQWSDCGSANQRWRIDVAADGSWTLVNAASGYMMSIPYGYLVSLRSSSHAPAAAHAHAKNASDTAIPPKKHPAMNHPAALIRRPTLPACPRCGACSCTWPRRASQGRTASRISGIRTCRHIRHRTPSCRRLRIRTMGM